MKKVISFSLWGDNPKYLNGAIRNAELARELFSDWTCRFYVGSSVSFKIIEELTNPIPKQWSRYKIDKGNIIGLCGSFNPLIEIYHMDFPGDWRMMFDRFRPVFDQDVDVTIVRDCDSRLSLREKAAVDEWLASPYGFHTMNDHYLHSVPIMGGMWGMKRDTLPAFQYLMENWIKEDRLQTDQEFLAQEIWPRVKDNCLRHDDGYYNHLWGGKPFPTPFDGINFVGASYGSDDKINQQQVDELQKFLRKRR